MKIKSVRYSALFNLGNYNNEKIGFTADIDEGETVEEVIEKLRANAAQNALPNIDAVRDSIRKAQLDLQDLEYKLHKARKEWDATAEFLIKQGIKPDATYMPKFNYLLPGISEEEVKVSEKVSEGELETDNINF